jgi:prepilin-type N-terminal cleavage/methylation domain-containing protein
MSNIKKTGFRDNTKRAFTLVELAIVLVIIGLLIVAITSGQSLVKNAKLRSITNESKQHQVAVMSFYSKFDAYPGDFNQPLSTASKSVAGNGNNKIEWVTKIPATTGIFVAEGSNAWHHLIAEVIDLDILGASPNLQTPLASVSLILGTDYPSSSQDGAGWVFGSQPIGQAVDLNYVYLTGAFTSPFGIPDSTDSAGDPVTGTPAANVGKPTGMFGIISTTDAYSIDKKNDNGSATDGGILGAEDCAGDYNLASDSTMCVLAFKVSI